MTITRTTILLCAISATLAVLLLGPWGAKASAACAKAGAPAYSVAPKTARKATLCLINKQRAKRGMRKLKPDGKANRAARRHTRVMIRKNCFAHECPGERDLVGRLLAVDYLGCNCTWGVAENIAWGGGRLSSPAAIVKAWMHSPGHRANILNRSYEHIGIGIRAGSPSGGGKAATYTTDFGFRD